MHAATFSVLFIYPTLTRGKMIRVVSADMKNRCIALSYLYRWMRLIFP